MFLDQSRLQAPLHVPGRRRRRFPPAGAPAVRRRHDPAPQAAVHRRHGAVRERRADPGAALLHQAVELGRGALDLVQASVVLVIQLQTTFETDFNTSGQVRVKLRQEFEMTTLIFNGLFVFIYIFKILIIYY
jgi:hypothetical protein